MVAIVPNRVVEFILLVIMIVTVYYYLRRVDKGLPLPKFRVIPAVLAIEEGVGRSLEVGKPVHFTMGSDGAPLTSSGMSTVIASLGILRHTAKLCAGLAQRLIIHLPSQAYAIPLIEGVTREAYLEAGRPELLQPGDMHYYGWLTAAFSPGVYESFSRDGVGLFIHTGYIITYEFPVLEAAKIHKAMSIGGTPRWTATYIFAIACDYFFIGEEMLAAGAQVSGDPLLTSGLASEEIWKFLALGLLIIGLILTAVGVPFSKIITL
jgi:hypothetical protein